MSVPDDPVIRLGRRATIDDPLRLGIMLSGRGSNMVAIARACESGELPAQVALVATDRPGAPGLAKARELGLATFSLDMNAGGKADCHRQLVDELVAADVEVVALAGYMRLLPTNVVAAFRHRIVNIHPSLLPSFPGLKPHEQALAHGVKVSGCTVHLVDSGVDTGPILLQKPVPVDENDTPDTLAARILEVEHRLYPKAVRLMASGRLVLSGRRVYHRPVSHAGEGSP